MPFTTYRFTPKESRLGLYDLQNQSSCLNLAVLKRKKKNDVKLRHGQTWIRWDQKSRICVCGCGTGNFQLVTPSERVKAASTQIALKELKWTVTQYQQLTTLTVQFILSAMERALEISLYFVSIFNVVHGWSTSWGAFSSSHRIFSKPQSYVVSFYEILCAVYATVEIQKSRAIYLDYQIAQFFPLFIES